MAATNAIRQIGVSEVTSCRWRKGYRGMAIHQLNRLKEVEKENQRLLKAVSDLTLDKLILKEAVSGKYFAPRAIVMAAMPVRQPPFVSERRTCRVIGQHRSTQRTKATGKSG